METEHHDHLFPAARAAHLERTGRKLFQNPWRMLRPYVQEGMTVLDFGCGPGFFSIPAAKRVGASGKVIAADLQEDMLKRLREKIAGTELERRIILHRTGRDETLLTESVDFILALYVVHEVPDQKKLFAEWRSILKPGGRILIVEPKGHVTAGAFDEMLSRLRQVGFRVLRSPHVFFSRAVVVEGL